LLAFGYNNKIVEFDEGMNEVFSYTCQGPWSAVKLPNGNYLIAEYRQNRVIEVSPETPEGIPKGRGIPGSPMGPLVSQRSFKKKRRIISAKARVAIPK